MERDRVVPDAGAQQVADVELAVLGGDHAVATDESAGGPGLGVVLDHEQVAPRAVATEDRRRELGRGRGAPGFAFGLHQLLVHLVDRVAHRRREVGVVAHVVEPVQRGGERGGATFELGRDPRHLVEWEATADDLERLGMHRGGE